VSEVDADNRDRQIFTERKHKRQSSSKEKLRDNRQMNVIIIPISYDEL
jgi:hypothetical protein